jgi:TRAP-type C4-dicarboxylate transport system permease large subunit
MFRAGWPFAVLAGITFALMTLPNTLPLAVMAGFAPVWFGIFMLLVIEAG